MKRIIVVKRTADYMAMVEDDPGKWDCGKGVEEAIGALVLTHREVFGVDIKTPYRPEQSPPAPKGGEP